MTYSADPRSIADLTWFYEEAEGEMKRLGSTWQDTLLVKAQSRSFVRLNGHYVEAAPLRCGPIYVPKAHHSHPTGYHMDFRALNAATRYRRISQSLEAAGQEVSTILRFRFRELLPACRFPFGLHGMGARRGRPINGAIGIRLTNMRGAGNLAHLTEAALAAHRAVRTRVPLPVWIDRLGIRLTQPVAPAEERALGKAIALECELMEMSALARYRAAIVRVPERVRRQASQRGVPRLRLVDTPKQAPEDAAPRQNPVCAVPYQT